MLPLLFVFVVVVNGGALNCIVRQVGSYTNVEGEGAVAATVLRSFLQPNQLFVAKGTTSVDAAAGFLGTCYLAKGTEKVNMFFNFHGVNEGYDWFVKVVHKLWVDHGKPTIDTHKTGNLKDLNKLFATSCFWPGSMQGVVERVGIDPLEQDTFKKWFNSLKTGAKGQKGGYSHVLIKETGSGTNLFEPVFLWHNSNAMDPIYNEYTRFETTSPKTDDTLPSISAAILALFQTQALKTTPLVKNLANGEYAIVPIADAEGWGNAISVQPLSKAAIFAKLIDTKPAGYGAHTFRQIQSARKRRSQPWRLRSDDDD